MKVKLPSGKTEEINLGPISVESLLRELKISQGEVLVSKDGCIIPVDTMLNNDDDVRIMQVVFGG